MHVAQQKSSLSAHSVEILRNQLGAEAQKKVEIPRSLAKHYSKEVLIDVKKQLAVEATDKAIEMLGPMLVTLRAASAAKRNIEQTLINYDFEKIAELWSAFVEARCNSTASQLHALAQVKLGRVDRIQVLDGDPHNSAYQPLRLTVQQAKKLENFVFKSVDSTAHQLIHDTAQLVTNELGLANIIEPIFWKNQDAFLRKFTPSEVLDNEKQVFAYFYRFGVICSIASLLEISDLHFENIVTTKKGPSIIDAEFIFSSSQYQTHPWTYKTSGLFEPSTSPIAQARTHRQINPFLKIIEENVYYEFLQPKYSTAHLITNQNGEIVNPLLYSKIITDGALDSDSILHHNPELLFSIAERILSTKHNIRCWIRSTGYYRILQLQLWLPQPARLSDRVELLRKKLSRRNTLSREISKSTRLAIVEAEIDDICKGDIPFFWIEGKSGALMHFRGLIKENFTRPSLEIMEEKIISWPSRNYKRDFSKILNSMISGMQKHIVEP